MEKLKLESSLEETLRIEGVSREAEAYSSSEITRSKKIKPRAIVFKATDKDLEKIKELIESQFKIEIIYVTTGPAASILNVTKSMPFETQNSAEQPLYTIE
jgi:hypothetical protein